MKVFLPVMQRVFFVLVVFWALFQTVSVAAGELAVTRYFSGHWEQPQQESQGLILQVIDQLDGSKQAVVYWFTFGGDLGTAWYLGVGPVEGDHIDLTLYSAFGVDFMQDDAPGDAEVDVIGSMFLSFTNCNHGTAVFDTPPEAIGSGEFPIKRLSSLYRSRCSGGISDDTPSNAKPSKLEVALLPARDGINGSGKARFWERVDRSDFQVEAEDLADGIYSVEVCGNLEGELTVAGGEGELEYRSPQAEGKLLLTFDPRPCLIRLLDGEGAVLTSGEALLAAKDTGQGNGQGGGSGNLRIDVELDSTGLLPGAEGSAEYSVSGNNTEFEVEVEDVPAGLYPLYVDGVLQGEVEVVEDGDDAKGKLKFSEPQKGEALELTFDPRGTVVEVYSGDGPILETLFPEE